jgi:hypothetical protein
MNWESVLTEVILSVVGIVFSALGALVTYWISKRIKDEKLKGIMNSLHELVKDATLEVYQTYVEGLKERNLFDLEAQKTALSKALAIIKGNMPQEVGEWLKTNASDLEGYLKSMIEAQIALLKK